eukprot:TRINITY_DN13474_c0_g1_i1.p1 TRINITY_DN13474_c0_g1~~TRINITY_DN13474_c0_g1_i1.p1  ORF type:complete len:109 (-),score=19.36 TRINITY_DN13474_c0_g1_i1:200-526(-)
MSAAKSTPPTSSILDARNFLYLLLGSAPAVGLGYGVASNRLSFTYLLLFGFAMIVLHGLITAITGLVMACRNGWTDSSSILRKLAGLALFSLGSMATVPLLIWGLFIL